MINAIDEKLTKLDARMAAGKGVADLDLPDTSNLTYEQYDIISEYSLDIHIIQAIIFGLLVFLSAYVIFDYFRNNGMTLANFVRGISRRTTSNRIPKSSGKFVIKPNWLSGDRLT